MEQIMSATQARINFGKAMRLAIEKGPVIVERDGKPEVVILSKQSYDELCSQKAGQDWRSLLAEAQQQARQDLAGKTFPPPEEVLSKEREDRDDRNNLR
jgi:prevent-host-death family protein